MPDARPIPLCFSNMSDQGQMTLTIDELHALLEVHAIEVRSKYIRSEITKRLAEHYGAKAQNLPPSD